MTRQEISFHDILEPVSRHTDATFINEVVNDPSVYPWVHGVVIGPLDLTGLVANKSNHCIMGKHGGVIFTQCQPGLYEAHTQVLPEGRGKWTIKMVKSALHYIFTRTDAMEILTRVPHGNLGAKALVRSINGEFQFTRPKSWVFDHKPVDSDIYSLGVQSWMRDAKYLKRRGEWFHQRLEGEYCAMGRTIPLHEDDTNHDQYVGGAIEMIMNGQPIKGQVMYNRWATIADYMQVQMLSLEPLLFDIQEALLLVKNGDFKVVSCR